MKIEIKEHDYFKREHTVSYNFTVRTNGYNSWKINVIIRCGIEKLEFDYLTDDFIVDSYMTQSGDHNKGKFLWLNLPTDIKEAVFSWLSDFARYHIIETSTMEKLCNARTYAEAQDEQNNFTFETLILDTWKI